MASLRAGLGSGYVVSLPAENWTWLAGLSVGSQEKQGGLYPVTPEGQHVRVARHLMNSR